MTLKLVVGMAYCLKGSSHLKQFDSRKGFNKYPIKSINSYNGLTLLDTYFDRETLKTVPKPAIKKKQVEEFTLDVSCATEHTLVLLALSNDSKSFLALPKKFFVHGVSEDISENKLKNLFGKFGEVTEISRVSKTVVLIYKHISDPDGFFANNFEIDGTKLKITEGERQLMSVSDSFADLWRSWPVEKKSNFNVLTSKHVYRSYISHLKFVFKKYQEVLAKILKNSRFEVVHHVSVLERLHPKFPNYDVLFGIVNSALRKTCDFWSKNKVFKNKFGKIITIKFLDVQHLFWEAPCKKEIFIKKEVLSGGECTHRKVEEIRKILTLISECCDKA